MAGVERGLTTAHLRAREQHLEACVTEELLGIFNRLGEDQVAKTGSEELDSLSHVRERIDSCGPILSHPDFETKHPTGSHPEKQERITALLQAFPGYDEPRRATVDEIVLCHDRDYIAAIRRASEHGSTTYLDPDTICTPTSFDLALLAAGSSIEAVERSGFSFARPPGHHAFADRAMGFCLFNNVAIAARFALQQLDLRRVAILDWDVHHGNGTQDLFWNESDVLFVSLHQWPFYPGSGGPDEGNETTVNVPLRAGSGDELYAEAMTSVVEPAIERFDPDLLLISAGYDAAVGDPLGGMQLTQAGYREMATRAGRLCERTAFVLEGGYNIETLPGLVSATLEADGCN